MPNPQNRLPRTNPEAAGVSSAAVLAFIDAVNASVGGLHSFMLLRHGRVAVQGWWAPYTPESPHSLFSLSKSFTSTAVGLAVSEGLLTVDDPVLSFFPDRPLTDVSENLAAMRVRHLLTMTTGHDEDATGPATAAEDGDWVRAFLSVPVEHAPGTKFVYNSAATYMCSAIVQKLTGQTLLEYLTPRLFGPLGIENPVWESCPRGINVGGWGLSITTEDIARFGQCYLQDGCWDGRQLVPASWVAQATSKQVPNGEGDDSDWTQGYGFQFWRCRHNAYRGDGAFGQYCVVMPDQDAVLAITSGIGDMQAVLNAAWDHLVPGMQPASSGTTNEDLARKLASLQVPAPEGSATSETGARVSGRAYRLEVNEEKLQSVLFAFTLDGCRLTLRGDEGEQTIASGSEDWVRGETSGPIGLLRAGRPLPGKCAARGAWTDADTYTMKVCYTETPFVETVTCRFEGDGVTVTRVMNASFGPTERPTLVGRQ